MQDCIAWWNDLPKYMHTTTRFTVVRKINSQHSQHMELLNENWIGHNSTSTNPTKKDKLKMWDIQSSSSWVNDYNDCNNKTIKTLMRLWTLNQVSKSSERKKERKRHWWTKSSESRDTEQKQTRISRGEK